MPELSVVIAHTASQESLKRCMDSLRTSCAGVDAQLIVTDAPARLVPELWGDGIARATGDIVALTTSQCAVAPNWAAEILAPFASGATGVGGTFGLGAGATLTDRAMFYLRYSAFITGSPGVAAGIAGDNAAYRRDVLRRHAGSFRDGFWEVEFHHRVHADGGTLVVAPGARALVGRGAPIHDCMAQRFAHGRHFGAWRALTAGHSTLRSLAAVPLVPFVLAARAARRALAHREHRAPFLTSLPHFLLLAAAWAVGEGVGALAPPHARPVREVAA